MLIAQIGHGTGNIEGATQLAELGLALVLSAVIGLEREVHQKSAGLRTHSLVGVGAALFMLVSKYGFTNVLVPNQIVVDPSRVAAQIVTGIGFLGAGLIFVRSDAVRGLTTAAAVWLTAAVGACAGAGLPLLAITAAAMYFLVTLGFSRLSRRLPSSRWAPSELAVRYQDGRGLLRKIMREVTASGFAVADLSTESSGTTSAAVVELSLHVYGRGSMSELATKLNEIDGVEAVRTSDANSPGE